MKKNVYIFSGLGADERVFQKIDFSDYNATFIHWIKPIPKEAIEKYAYRILNQIKSERPILIGLSFGGIMAVEIGKLIDTEKIILISSAKSKKEIPFYFRLVGLTGIQNLLPAGILKKTNRITDWLFGADSAFERGLLKQILIDTDSHFLKWAIGKIVNWKNTAKSANLFHIHGSTDKILPINFVDYNYKVVGGGHFMILNKHLEINEKLKQLI